MKVIRIIACILLLSVFSLINVVHAQSVTLIPKWTAQAQFAGYYVAEKMGFYKEEGLDVHVKHPSLIRKTHSSILKKESRRQLSPIYHKR